MSFKLIDLRDRLVTTITGLPTTGARVYAARAYPVQDTDCPALTVQVGETEQEIDAMGDPPSIHNRTEYQIRVHVSETTDTDAALFAIAKEVFEALGADTDLNGEALGAYAGGISEPENTGDGQQQIAHVDLVWAVEYTTTLEDWD